MHQSIHEMLPEMAWQIEVLRKSDEIIALLREIAANRVDIVIPDDIDWESIDLTDLDVSDYVNM